MAHQSLNDRPSPRLVLMGVSGCGKSTVGLALSQLTGLRFVDGDDLHPAANIARMRAGQPLQDSDRWPWLDRVAQGLATEAPVAIACSALRRSYRDRIRAQAGGPVGFVWLSVSLADIARRLSTRQGHFMPAALLESQFATLEPPTDEPGVLTVDALQDTGTLARQIALWAGLGLIGNQSRKDETGQDTDSPSRA